MADTNSLVEISRNNNKLIQSMENEFAKVLPAILSSKRFCRVVSSMLAKNPALATAMSDPRSQASALSSFMRCAEMGLLPDGRQATITAYRKKSGGYDITMVPMYQGLCELAMRSGLISNIHAEKVCEKDVFEWDTGLIQKHVVNWKEDRGPAYLYYCRVRMKDGSIKDEVMTKAEIEAIRNKSSGYKAAINYGSTNPWIDNFDEMARKTVFRRVAKWLPLSPELQSGIIADDEDYERNAEPAAPASGDGFFAAVNMSEVQEAETVPVDPEADSKPAEGLFQE